jgi:hypothetical protein
MVVTPAPTCTAAASSSSTVTPSDSKHDGLDGNADP